jgi:aminoglycoside 6'-N-acetyltransferase
MISFRALDRGDLPMMYRWLNTPHVAEWWSDEGRSLDEIVAKYSPRIDGKEDVRCFVIVIDGTTIGYIQEYPDGENSAGIDLFIGEIEFLHRLVGCVDCPAVSEQYRVRGSGGRDLHHRSVSIESCGD